MHDNKKCEFAIQLSKTNAKEILLLDEMVFTLRKHVKKQKK
jgi:hypothetical protein